MKYQFYSVNKAKYQIAKKELFLLAVEEAGNRACESGDYDRAERYQVAMDTTIKEIKALEAHIAKIEAII